MKKLAIIILLGALCLMVGCNLNSKDEKEERLTLSVAASLTDCMMAMEEAFSAQHPEIKLQFNFGASGTLQQQIQQGAPVDIFFSAGTKQMEALNEKGLLVEDSIEDILMNRLALIVPKNETKAITFETLVSDDIEPIAIGEVESVPVGQYTLQVFDALGITEALKPRLVYAKDVREVLSWVEVGSAAAGVVYETDAKISDQVKISDLADESLHSPIVYPIGIIKNTEHLESAQLFIDFLKTEEAKNIWNHYGFTPIFS